MENTIIKNLINFDFFSTPAHYYYSESLSLSAVLTVSAEYFLVTSVLTISLFFVLLPKVESRFSNIQINIFSFVNYQLNFLAILIIVFYCFLSMKQYFLFLSLLPSFNNSILNDFTSLFAKTIIGFSSIIYLLFIQKYLIDQKLNYFEYYILILTSILGFCLLCCSNDLLTAYLAIELQGLSFYLLSSFKKSSNYSIESGIKYFIIGSFSTILFLLGVNLLYGISGTIYLFDFKDLFVWVFSVNSFFLSFEYLPKAFDFFNIEKSFNNQEYCFSDDVSSFLNLRTIFDKFLLFKHKAYVTLPEGLNLLSDILDQKTYFEHEFLIVEGIANKMIDISNQADLFFFNERVTVFKVLFGEIHELILLNYFQNLVNWFLVDIQSTGSKFDSYESFIEQVLLLESEFDVLNKFQYNWVSVSNIENQIPDTFDYFISSLTKEVSFKDWSEYLAFRHLSESIDMALTLDIFSDVDSTQINSSKVLKKLPEKKEVFSFSNFELILEKFKRFGYINLEDAKFILNDMNNVLNEIRIKANEQEFFYVVADYSNFKELDDFKNFMEFSNDSKYQFYKNFSNLMLNLTSNIKYSDIYSEKEFVGFLTNFNQGIDAESNELFKKMVNYRVYGLEEFFLALSYHITHSGVLDPITWHIIYNDAFIKNATLVSYFLDSFNYLSNFVENDDFFSDTKSNIEAITADFEKACSCKNPLKEISDRFDNSGKKTTLSLSDARFLILQIKKFFQSKIYDSNQFELLINISDKMKNNFTIDDPTFINRSEILKNSKVFSFFISDFKSILKETNDIVFSSFLLFLDTNDIIKEDFNNFLNEYLISILNIKKLFDLDILLLPTIHKFNSINKFIDFLNLNCFDIYSENDFSIFLNSLFLNSMDSFNDIYNPCANLITLLPELGFYENPKCLQLVDSVAKDLSISKKSFIAEAEVDYFKKLSVLLNHLLFYVEPLNTAEKFSILPRELNYQQKIDFLDFIIFKIKHFKNNFKPTRWEFEFLLNELKDYRIISSSVQDSIIKKKYKELFESFKTIVSVYLNNYHRTSQDVNIFSSSSDYKYCYDARQNVWLTELTLNNLSLKKLLKESTNNNLILAKTLTNFFWEENILSSYQNKKIIDILPEFKNFKNSEFNLKLLTKDNDFINLIHVLNLLPLFLELSEDSILTNMFMFDSLIVELGLFLIIISLFFKLALTPFHLWSPDVYEGSPSSTTFFFVVVSKISIFMFLLKICYLSFYSFITNWQFYSLVVAISSILLGSIAALKQRKLKSLLAYSSISNIGLILAAFSAGNFEGIKAVFYYFIIYIISGLAIWSIFLAFKLKKNNFNEKYNKDLGDFTLLHESNGFLSYAFVVTIFTAAGIPPMAGFLAKVSIFLTLVVSSMNFIAVISIVISVISTFYYIRILKVIFFENVLIGKLFYPINSKTSIIQSFLFFLMFFFFLSPLMVHFISYKVILFFSKSFY